MSNQFAGHGMYDNSAVCLTCGHQHLLPKGEAILAQAWLDWLHKHDGHENFVVPTKLLNPLGEQMVLRHNADVKVSYAASAAYTITLTGLATSSTLLAGREGTAVSNASNKYLDEIIAGQVMTGTTPTTAKQIELHVVGSIDDTPTYPDVFDGTDSAETITTADIKAAICKLAGFSSTDATSNQAYPFAPVGIRGLFGADALPVAHVPFVTHSTAVNLHITATNHFIKHTPVYATVV